MARGVAAGKTQVTQALDFLDGEEVEVAPQSDLPRTSFVSVEYPGILRNVISSAQSAEHPSLTNALRSLSPLPPSYATPNSALRHISQSLRKNGLTSLECKLGQACIDASIPFTAAANGRTQHVTANDVFRHAILGDFIDSHNVVLKITKRTWRRKCKDTASSSVISEFSDRREYTAVALGITRKIARFRNLADFQYDPGLIEDDQGAEGKQVEATQLSLEFHDHLRQMNIEALQSFTLNVEEERYEVERYNSGNNKTLVSDIRLPPPPMFDRADVPFMYGFRQNNTSNLRPYGKVKNGVQPMRYVNKQKFDNLSPIQVSWIGKGGQDMIIPVKPHDEILSKQRDLTLCRKLEELFQQQPIWTRTSIENQFDAVQRRNLRNQKYHYAAYCYTINDGCWRDTLVRFGYDPRASKESRFYQKLTFQMKDKSRRGASTKRFSMLPSANERIDTSNRQDEEAEEDELDDFDSHIFDGIKVRRKAVNFLLIDVHDEYIRPLIQQEGEGILRDVPDRDTGWYSQKHYDKIRYTMHARFHRIHEGKGPASKEECDAIVAQVEAGAYTRPAKQMNRPQARSVSTQ